MSSQVADLYAVVVDLSQWSLSDDPTGMYALIDFGHDGCDMSVFCRNPLHPGPCKGWKGTLGKVAPGALHAIEAARKEKTAAKRKASAAAKSAGEAHAAGLPARDLVHPLAGKKAAVKHAQNILGADPVKAANKVAKTKLTKPEIARFAKFKGAQLANDVTDRGVTSDKKSYTKYATGVLAGALAKDNEEGGDKHYRAAMGNLAGAAGEGYADAHLDGCGIGTADADCDGKAHEGLSLHAADAFHQKFLYGTGDKLAQLDHAQKQAGGDPEAWKAYLKHQGVDTDKLNAPDDAPEPDQVDTPTPAKSEPSLPPSAPKIAAPAGQPEHVTKALAMAAAIEGSPNIATSPFGAEAALDLLGNMSPDDFDALNDQQRASIVAGIRHAAKYGKPKDKQYAKEILDTFGESDAGVPDKNLPESDVLTELLDAVPMAGGPVLSDNAQKAAAAAKGITGAAGAIKMTAGDRLNLYSELTAEDWVALEQNDKAASDAITGDLTLMQTGLKTPEAQALAWTMLKEKNAATAPVPVTHTPVTPGAPTTAAMDAADVAKGIVKIIAKKKVEVYQALTPTDFGSLGKDDQDAIMADLDAIKAKFLDPKKKATVQQIKDDLSVGSGGGAGAGGGVPSIFTPNEITMLAENITESLKDAASTADEVDIADQNLANMEKMLAGLGPDDLDPVLQSLAKFTAPKLVELAEKKTGFKVPPDDKVILTDVVQGALLAQWKGEKMSPNNAITVLNGVKNVDQQDMFETVVDLAKVKAAALSTSSFDADAAVVVQMNKLAGTSAASFSPTTKNVIAAVLKKELIAVNAGGPGSSDTPGLDALDALVDGQINKSEFLDVITDVDTGITPKPLPGFTVKAIAQQQGDLYESLLGEVKGGLDPNMPPFNKTDFVAVTASYLDSASKSGGLLNAIDVNAEGMGSTLGTAAAQQALKDLDLEDFMGFGMGSLESMADALRADYKDALVENYHPKGIAHDLPGIIQKTNDAADALATKNGWPADSDALQKWKAAYFEAKIQPYTGGAGAGGTSTPPPPAVATAVSTAVGTPVTTPAGMTTPIAPLGSGTDIAHFAPQAVDEILADLKALPKGQYLDSDEPDIYDNLVALAAIKGAVGKYGGPVSILQILKAVDQASAKKVGVANGNLLEKKITAWLQTPAGTAYATANSSPNIKLVKKIAGEFTPPKNITLAPGQKVQVVGGPGKYKTSKKATDFKGYTSAQAQAQQTKYFKANPDTEWDDDQEHAYGNYSGSQYAYNEYLRGTIGAAPHIKEQIVLMQAGMTPIQEDQLLLRGTGFDALPPGIQTHAGAQSLVGKTLQDPAFLSTSVAGSGGHFSSKPVIFTIEAPKGTMGAMIDVISHFKGIENEMLLAAGTKLRILAVEKVGSQTHIRVRVVS